MADIELRDVDGTILVQFGRNPSFPWVQTADPNVVVGRTVGRKARSSRRGETLLVNHLQWRNLHVAAGSQLLNALRDYAGGAKPLLLHLEGSFEQAADDTREADGTLYATGDFRCRIYEAPEIIEISHAKCAVSLTLVQDLT